MASTAYLFTPKPLLKAVIMDADSTVHALLRMLGIEATGNPVIVTSTQQPATADTSTTDIDATQEGLLDAEVEIDALMLAGDVAGAATRAEAALDAMGDVAVNASITNQQDPGHLEESAQLVAATTAVRELQAGADAEGEADEALEEFHREKAAVDINCAKQRGAGAHRECLPQKTQRKSAMLERLDAVLSQGSLSSLIDCLIEVRSETEKLAGMSVKTMERTAEQAKAHEAANAGSKSKVKLELDGKDIDPSTALRLQRQGVVEQFNAQRKKARLQRWMDGTTSLIKTGMVAASPEHVTVDAGDVWLYADSPTAVVPVVVIPFHSFKNGVRPWTSLVGHMQLKQMSSAQLLVRVTVTRA